MTKRLRTALVVARHAEPLRDGSIKPRTFEFEFEDVPHLAAFRRMVRSQDFDICELAMTTYLCARAYGKPFTAIPVFPWRAFHHGAIVHNTKSGVNAPKDLEGRKVGVNRGYTVTASVWARGILEHQYGVDLDKITWVRSGDEHVGEYQPPPNVVPIEKGKTLEELVASGEIPAATGLKIDSPDVKPLIPNAHEAGVEALRRTGHYPINHTVVVRNDVLHANPGLADDLYDTFVQAKQWYVDRLTSGQIENPDPVHVRATEIIGDPLPYGIEPNRQMLEALIGYAVEQHIVPQRFAVEELFAIRR
jgi:4,5-dihydroxyphthalate decarboxylase